MKALVAAFNQEKALVGAFSMIVQLHRLILYTALPVTGDTSSNGAASPGRGAVVVDAELAVALARGQGTLLVSPLAAAL